MASASGRQPVRIGVVGFGVGGNCFHAPFIEAAAGVELAGVVTASPQRRRQLAERFPGVPAYDSIETMVSAERAGAGLDAVTIRSSRRWTGRTPAAVRPMSGSQYSSSTPVARRAS